MDGNIYIISSANVLSGGVSSLHNLCKSLILNNQKAAMYYIDADEKLIGEVLIKKFGVPRVYEILDHEQNILIVPEIFPHLLNNFNHIIKVVYWLSLKFYFKDKLSYNWLLKKYPIRKIVYPADYFGTSSGLIETLKQKILYWGLIKSPTWDHNIFHICNSFYTYSFVKSMKANNAFILQNPLISEVFGKQTITVRKKQILIGARSSKMLEYCLKKAMPEFRIIRVKRLNIEQVYKLMSESVIYADFSISNRDRAPREASLLGCIAFTSNRGSAKHYEDVPIPDYYKIEWKISNFVKIVKSIKYAATNYEKLHSDFDLFREQTIKEKESFNIRVIELFKNINK